MNRTQKKQGAAVQKERVKLQNATIDLAMGLYVHKDLTPREALDRAMAFFTVLYTPARPTTAPASAAMVGATGSNVAAPVEPTPEGA